MNVCEILCEVLEPLGFPVAENVYIGDEEEYITFNVLSERPVLSADDECIEEVSSCYVHFFTRNDPHGNKTKIKKILHKNDIGITDIECLYENETGFNHIVFHIEVSGYENYESEE